MLFSFSQISYNQNEYPRFIFYGELPYYSKISLFFFIVINKHQTLSAYLCC